MNYDQILELQPSAREARLQDEYNAKCYEEEQMRLELNKAFAMLFRATGPRPTIEEAELLAADILAVAAEPGFESGSIHAAARELERRIGGPANVRSYLRTLQASTAKIE